MAPPLIKISTLAALISLCACSTAKQNPAENSADFSTGLIPANFKLENSSLANPVELLYRVDVHFDGQKGDPTKTELTFHLRPGPTKVYLQSRSLSIKAGEKTFDWPGREWTNIYDSPPVLGNITTVNLSYDDLNKIADADAVTGNLSGQNFKWSYQNREPIRQLIAKIDTETPQND